MATTTHTNNEKEYTDEELYNYLKELPEFDNLALPKSWIDKFNIKIKKPDSFKDCVDSLYALKMAYAPKDLPYEVFKTPADYKFEPVKVDDVPLIVESKPLETKTDNEVVETKITEIVN